MAFQVIVDFDINNFLGYICCTIGNPMSLTGENFS
jgi:hypothetical protein